MFIGVRTKFKATKNDKSFRRQVIGRFEIIPVMSSEDPQTAWCKQHMRILQSTNYSWAQVE